MSDFEKKLQELEKGRMSELAYRFFSGIINGKKNDILQKMKQDYYSGNFEKSNLVSIMSSYTVLDDLDSRIEKQIYKSRQIEQEGD